MDERQLEIEHRLTKVEEAVSVLPNMQATLNEMANKFARYEGKWGTFTLVGTAIWAVFVVFKDDIVRWFKN